jgi:glycosyltransferase involved in cell wall biosynthesis
MIDLPVCSTDQLRMSSPALSAAGVFDLETESSLQRMTFLWVVNFVYPARLHHGSTLRHVNYARELQALGHKVYFGVQFEPEYLEESRQWFAGLREQGVISDFFELCYNPSTWHRRLATLMFHPYLANRILGKFQSDTTREVRALIAKLEISAVILSDRQFWFLADTLMSLKPLVVDVCDCASLYMAREIRQHVKARRFAQVRQMFKHFLYTVSEDRYYARRGDAAVVVSPVDQRALARLSGGSSHVVTLLNGVSIPPTRPDLAKIKNRLIFSGNMDFPPNYSGALWFLDYVFPRVLEQVPDAQFVLAGANPPLMLRDRASRNVAVTGYVDDLNAEIARSALYVAPMVTGGGFKNKVVEAIVNRTYVVATPLAVEFLDPDTRSLIAVAEGPEQMAELIVQLLRDPSACSLRLSALYDHVTQTFTWAQRAGELLEIIRTRTAQGPPGNLSESSRQSTSPATNRKVPRVRLR